MAKKVSNLEAALVYIIVVMFPLAAYRLAFLPEAVSFTVDRMALLVILFIYLSRLAAGTINISLVETISVAFVIWITVVSVLNGRVFVDYHLMLVFGILLLVISFQFAKNASFSQLQKFSIAASVCGLIICLFSLYTVLVFRATGRFPDQFPVGPFGNIIQAKEGHVFEHGGFHLGELTRLALPFSRPQELGITAAVLVFLIAMLREVTQYKHVLQVFLIGCLTLVVFFTGSRSAVFPFVLGVIIFYFSSRERVTKVRLPYVLFALVSLILVVIVLVRPPEVVLANSEAYLANFSRLVQIVDGASSEAHLSIRKIALDIAMEDGLALVSGLGIGGFARVTGVSSAHSTFFTLLVDVGIIGVVIFSMFFAVLFWKLLKYRGQRDAMMAIVAITVAAHVLYHVPTLLIMWIAMGTVWGIVSRGGVPAKGYAWVNRAPCVSVDV